MRNFDWVLNYELLNAIGAKWVICLGRQAATGGLSTPLPCPPYNTDKWKLGLRSSSYPMAHSPVWHSVCPCTVGCLPYQPFSFIAVFVPKLPGYSLLHLLIKIKLYFKTIQTLESLWLFFLLRICIGGQINSQRYVKNSCSRKPKALNISNVWKFNIFSSSVFLAWLITFT